MKLNEKDLQTADNKSLGYSQSILNATGETSILVMSCIVENMLPIDGGKHAVIEICRVENSDKWSHFFLF